MTVDPVAVAVGVAATGTATGTADPLAANSVGVATGATVCNIRLEALLVLEADLTEEPVAVAVGVAATGTATGTADPLAAN